MLFTKSVLYKRLVPTLKYKIVPIGYRYYEVLFIYLTKE